jgi:hypothetical protein
MESLINRRSILLSAQKAVSYLIVFFLLSAGSLYAQTGKQQLYISMGDLGPSAKAFLKTNGVENVFTFNVVGNSIEKIDIAKITEAIKSKFPGASDGGIGSLDWEGAALNALYLSPAESPEFKSSLESFLILLKRVKALRPNVKWGFYDIPFATYYKRETLKNNIAKIEPLLLQCDVFFPTLYTPYKEGSISKGDNEAFATDNILAALMEAKRLNKPVLPFVWHRYHVSNKAIGLQLIPIDEFKRYLNTILSVNYQGYKVAGLVWWGSDTYYYNIKSKALVEEMRGNNQTNFAGYDDNLITNYGKEILKTIKKQ